MRVAIVTWGSRGDFQPFLALARGLARAGHEVRLGAPREPTFAAAAAEHAIPYTPLGPELELDALLTMVERLTGMWDPTLQARLLFDEYATPWLDQVYEECLALGRWSDVIVSHFFQLAGRMAAETLGRPWVSAALAQASIPSRYRPPPRLPDLGPRLNRPLWRLASAIGDRLWGRGINRARARVGLPPLRHFLDDAFYAPDLNLIAVSRHVAREHPDWLPRHRVTGYWFLSRPEWTPPHDLEAFVSREPAPVAIGFGSMAIAPGADLARLVARAAELSGARVVFQAAFSMAEADRLPPTVFPITGNVPHDWLFPRVAAVVHHGGAGTTASVLRAGVPGVLVPHLVDQFDWAEIAHELGVAPKPIPRRELTAERLARAIVRATRDHDMRDRAVRLGAAIRAEDGVGTAIRLVEEYVTDTSGYARGPSFRRSRTSG